MNLGALLLDGVKATVLGMATVFFFLTLMICFMKLLSKALAPFSNFLEPVVAQPKKKAKKKEAAGKTAEISAEDRVRALAAIEAVKLFRAGK